MRAYSNLPLRDTKAHRWETRESSRVTPWPIPPRFPEGRQSLLDAVRGRPAGPETCARLEPGAAAMLESYQPRRAPNTLACQGELPNRPAKPEAMGSSRGSSPSDSLTHLHQPSSVVRKHRTPDSKLNSVFCNLWFNVSICIDTMRPVFRQCNPPNLLAKGAFHWLDKVNASAFPTQPGPDSFFIRWELDIAKRSLEREQNVPCQA